jgi:HD-GYP domain-containing protein (c-di-GMP phosphodiesterase class II)
MGLDQKEIDVIVRGALVHDIGKVGVMDSIIGKQGRLTDEEYALVKKHPDIGVEILSRADSEEIQEIIPLVRFHHERWDGSGYPLGISGETIPLGARIIAVADTVDAMLSDRPYRKPPTFDEVKEEVLRCMGTQFDPRVVQAFFEVVREKGPEFFKNSAESVDKKYRPDNLAFMTPNARYLKKSMIWYREDQEYDD